ncbi:MAG TPA: sigma-70 family RNA polymerase sigma factor [Solirubrobacterales bacterium]|jgi:RNA polymerase sigma-70 factor (ECF subfamily)
MPATAEKAKGVAASTVERRAIAAAKEGDWSAVDYLYARYADHIQRFVQSIVHDHHAAEDVTQDVFARLLRIIRRYEERNVPFAAWLMRVARNAALDYLRARRQIPVEEVRAIAGDDSGYVPFEYRQSIHDALAELPATQREVLILRHVAGLSPGEIAELLGKTEPSIHGLHHRGRTALQRALREHGVAPVTRAAA